MSISEVQLKRLDSPEAEEVLLESGETFLGKIFFHRMTSQVSTELIPKVGVLS